MVRGRREERKWWGELSNFLLVVVVGVWVGGLKIRENIMRGYLGHFASK